MRASVTQADPQTSSFATLARALSASTAEGVAAPILAGMRARAVADACEQLDLPAVLIDGGGKVLHVGQLAGPHLQGTVGVTAGHLVGRTPAARRAVQAAVSAALGGSEPARRGGALTGITYRETSPVQRLRGVVVVGRPDRLARRRLATLRQLLGGGTGLS